MIKQIKLHAEIRFHLLNGPNYKHWQVKIVDNHKKVDEYYFDPNKYQLEMINCVLINKVNRAKKVHASGRKNVSGWIRCDEVILTKNTPIENLEKLHYNPIVDPFWRRESDNGEFIWDDSPYATLITDGKQVYVLEERT